MDAFFVVPTELDALGAVRPVLRADVTALDCTPIFDETGVVLAYRVRVCGPGVAAMKRARYGLHFLGDASPNRREDPPAVRANAPTVVAAARRLTHGPAMSTPDERPPGGL